jgi:hypothetical protein
MRIRQAENYAVPTRFGDTGTQMGRREVVVAGIISRRDLLKGASAIALVSAALPALAGLRPQLTRLSSDGS